MSSYCSECTYLRLESKDIYGKFWCDKKLEWHLANELKCDRFCEAYNRDSSVARSAYQYSIDHSSSESCYLTTMLCSILKMPDNNVYLNTLRNFRKNFLQKDEKYREILVEYDIIGPIIAKNLNEDPLKYQIAVNTFYNYVKPIVKLININNNDEAINNYINMTNKLKNLYSINNTVSIEIINNAELKESGHGMYKVKKLTSNI